MCLSDRTVPNLRRLTGGLTDNTSMVSWRPGKLGGVQVDTDPYSGATLAETVMVNQGDLDEAYRAATKAQISWAARCLDHPRKSLGPAKQCTHAICELFYRSSRQRRKCAKARLPASADHLLQLGSNKSRRSRRFDALVLTVRVLGSRSISSNLN